jgi:hypothetical protein
MWPHAMRWPPFGANPRSCGAAIGPRAMNCNLLRYIFGNGPGSYGAAQKTGAIPYPQLSVAR